MAARHRGLERALAGAALGLLVLQGLLLSALWRHPEAPLELPQQELPRRERARGEEPPPRGDRASVEVLDRLLSERLAQAALRAGRAVAGPKGSTREAALANPDPAGPAVAALIAEYSSALAGLGESLDATSTRANEAAPGTPGLVPDPR